MLLAHPFRSTAAVILVCAFLVDSCYTIHCSRRGYTDVISFFGFLKTAPWLRTAIKLPFVLLFLQETLNLGGDDFLGRAPIVSITYGVTVGYGVYRFRRAVSTSDKNNTAD
jgi:hypothetical protein